MRISLPPRAVLAVVAVATIVSCTDGAVAPSATTVRANAPLANTIAGMVAVCHAAGRASDPQYVAIQVGATGAAAHFANNGSPLAGHELDYEVTPLTPCPPPATPGELAVCKVGGAGVTAGASFAFVVNGQGVTVNAGQCTSLPFRVGTRVEVRETLSANTRLTALTVSPTAAGTADLQSATARVIVGTGTTTVTFTNEMTGTLRICKQAGPGVVVGTPFGFTVAGQTYTVAAGTGLDGSCLTIPDLTVGIVRVEEQYQLGYSILGIGVVNDAGSLVPNGISFAERRADVYIRPGQRSSVGFTNQVVQTGTLRICKQAGPGITPGTPFQFRVGEQLVTVAAGVGLTGSCESIVVNAGVQRITELVPAGTTILGIGIAGSGTIVPGSTSFASASVDMDIAPGTTSAIAFTNQAAVETATARICKQAGPGIAPGTPFVFEVLGTRYTVAAGIGLTGSCLDIPGIGLMGTTGVVRVRELSSPGTSILGIGVAGTGGIVSGSLDIANGSVEITLTAGQVSAIAFTNQAVQ